MMSEPLKVQFQLIAEATPVGLAIAEIATGQFLYTNEHMGSLFGLSAQALLNYRSSEFYANASDRQQALSLLANQGQFQGEVQFRRLDGTLFWGLLSLRPCRFQGVNTLLIALYDTDYCKQAQEGQRLRYELAISDDEHHQILSNLGIENPDLLDPNKQSTHEDWLRLESYREMVEVTLNLWHRRPAKGLGADLLDVVGGIREIESVQDLAI
ncbi:PAS domain-containing protein [Allocoleopsis sp.]|uniref:PAS domain-containing protein n=1 Tax=Allocoleopsis sp. TaxID=3088169 RepID=UPI002FD11820